MINLRRRLLLPVLAIASLGLTGCEVPASTLLQVLEDVLADAEENPPSPPSATPSPPAAPTAEPPSGSLSSKEQGLYDALMAYRAEKGLPRIPLSASLTKVARLHVKDLSTHHPDQGDCNMHSWSAQGPWTAVCYTSDHAEAEGMWNKPRELTPYPGNGYEISYRSSAGATAKGALDGWKGSARHNAVIANLGTWSGTDWQAIGVGIDGEYAVTWFGKEPDTTTAIEQ